MQKNNLYNMGKDNANPIWKKVAKVGEDMAVFKGYLRSRMRQLKLLKKAIASKDFETASSLVDELIEDTQKNIED